MSIEAALLIGLGLFLGPVVSNWLVLRRPKDIVVSVQKTTNSASQPEIVTVQIPLPAAATSDQIWRAIELQGALPATSRMVSVNEMIMDATREMSEKIAAERPGLKDNFLRKLEKRRRRYAARTLGIPIDQVTDEQIQQLVAQAGGVVPQEPA